MLRGSARVVRYRVTALRVVLNIFAIFLISMAIPEKGASWACCPDGEVPILHLNAYVVAGLSGLSAMVACVAAYQRRWTTVVLMLVVTGLLLVPLWGMLSLVAAVPLALALFVRRSENNLEEGIRRA